MIPAEFYPPPRCAHCGQWHDGVCSRVKSVEYYPNGTVKKIKYHDSPPPPPMMPSALLIDPKLLDGY